MAVFPCLGAAPIFRGCTNVQGLYPVYNPQALHSTSSLVCCGVCLCGSFIDVSHIWGRGGGLPNDGCRASFSTSQGIPLQSDYVLVHVQSLRFIQRLNHLMLAKISHTFLSWLENYYFSIYGADLVFYCCHNLNMLHKLY